MYRIGIDIGATNMRAGLFDANVLVARLEMKTEAELGAKQALIKLVELVRLVDPKQLAVGIGIGAPGPLDAQAGIILDAPNLPGWNGFHLKDELSDHVGKPVFLMNDAKVAALAEAKVGAGLGYGSVQFITVSTGVGGGFVYQGEVFAGGHEHASEVGNMIVNVSDEQATLESVCSGTALLRESKQLFGTSKTAADLLRFSENNNPEANQVVDRWVHHFAAAITSIIQVIDPEVFVLGGAVILHNPWLVERVTEAVRAQVYQSMQDKINIKVASLGEDAGLYGAAMLVT
ncbi:MULTISPECIES: ROK family protein [unclassified Listeria]|uniref:ROK family protein n=1 Tax=unclassified Listeria TaxID=2642072 RepID=UPI000B589851|nr:MULTISPECIES: ROK family protein [unclassified Listeria]